MILSWNIRGFNSPLKQSELKTMIAKYKIDVMGVMETRIREENMSEVWGKLNLSNWNLVHNYGMNDQGRIWVLYDTSLICLRVLEVHVQFIHCMITKGNHSFYWTCVYGSYNSLARKELWRELTRIGNQLAEPWLIQGDFNAVCSNEDRIGGNPINEVAADEFQSWILNLELVEVPYSGPKFTWTNYQEGNKIIFRKLDWCFANQIWYSSLKEPICFVTDSSISDHCGLLVDTYKSKKNIKVPFKFFNIWCDHPDFLNTVQRIWNTPIRGCSMYVVYQKLILLRTELRRINRKDFENITRRIS